MTELLNRALQELAKLPPERQDELAAMLLDLVAREHAEFELTPEQEEGLKKAISQANRGEFAKPEDIEAIFAKYGA